MSRESDFRQFASANERQVGGGHYKATIQHWDFVISNGLGYLEGQITKYVTRWDKKNGLQDLYKARHFLDKLIESVENGTIKDPTVGSSQDKFESNMRKTYPNIFSEDIAPKTLASTI